MKIAIAQLNPKTGALEDNADAIKNAADRAWTAGADICLVSQAALVGPNPADLDKHESFETARAATREQLFGTVPEGKSLSCTGGPEDGAGPVLRSTSYAYTPGAREAAETALCAHAKESGRWVLSANLVGGFDDLVYEGASVAVDPEGQIRARLASWREDFLVIDLDDPPPPVPARAPREIEDKRDALVLGIRDYVHKSGFDTAVVGLSGGIDSSVTAYLAVEALGADKVIGASMSSRYSSDHSLQDAEALAASLGLRYYKLPIEPMHAAALEAIAPAFAVDNPTLTEQNMQARLRGVTLMALANSFGGMVMSTGNKSEEAMGYATLYGDTNGAICVLGDLYKDEVYAIARLANEAGDKIPERSIEKAPSAELSPGQKDSDSMPPYEQLDPMLRLFLEEQAGAEAMAKAGGVSIEQAEAVIRTVHRNEFKRAQGPVTLTVSAHPLSGRDYPIVHSFYR